MYEDKNESINHHKNEKRQILLTRKQGIRKILRCSWYISNADAIKIQTIK